MAKANITTQAKKRVAATKTRTVKTVRASERNGITIDAKAPELRDLMTEQSKTDTGYSTYYSGTPAEFIAAGIAPTFLPQGDRKKNFIANGHAASLRRIGSRFELELTWGSEGPWYHSAHHPALSEIARMIRIDVGYWMKGEGFYEHFMSENPLRDEVPVQKLIDSSGASDYRLPATKRFNFTKNFYINTVAPIIDRACRTIEMAEIMSLSNASDTFELPECGNVASLKPRNKISN